MRKRTQAREYALQLLYQYELNAELSDDLLQLFWEHHLDAPEATRVFAEKLVKGTIENLDKLNAIVSKYAENWQMSRMAIIDRNILRFAAYELLFCDDIPPKVTINEAVNIAKKFSQEDSGKFVNGILDKICHSENIRPASPAPPGQAL